MNNVIKVGQVWKHRIHDHFVILIVHIEQQYEEKTGFCKWVRIDRKELAEISSNWSIDYFLQRWEKI